MTSHKAARRRSGAFLIGSLFALSFAGLAAAPAQAQIDPGMIPVAGTWNRGDADTVGWVDLATWKLVTHFEGEGGRPFADPDPQPWLPVAGDWDGDGVDSIQMFNVQSWRLLPAEQGAVGDSFDPQPQPWRPVAGDWDGDGVDTVLVFDERDGSLHRLEEGPIRVERYEPDSRLQPIAADWDGDRTDTLATFELEETRGGANAWTFLSGDWDRDGVDTDAALYLPTGELVFPEEEEAPVRSMVSSPFGNPGGIDSIFAPSPGGGGCYTKITNWNQWTKVFKYGVGGCMVIINTTWIESSCCPVSPTGPYLCVSKLKMKVQTKSYSNC